MVRGRPRPIVRWTIPASFEAGYPNGLKVGLKNRNIRLPYQDFAVFVIREWRKIGVEAEHRPRETAACSRIDRTPGTSS